MSRFSVVVFVAGCLADPAVVIAQEAEYSEALRRAQTKDYDAAVSGFLSIIRNTPSFDRAYRSLAGVGAKSGRAQELRSEFERRMQDNPQSPYERYTLAELWLADGKAQEAEEAAWNAIRIDGRFAPTYETWLRAKRSQGRLADAEPVLLDLIGKDPLNAAIQHALGVYMLFFQKPREAILRFGEAVRLKPDQLLSLYGLHIAYYEVQDYKSALTVLDQMSALASPEDLDWQYYITGRKGVIQKDLGNHRDALVLLESATATARELGNTVRQVHFQGNLGSVYSYLGELEKAFAASKEVFGLAQASGDRLSEGRLHGQLARFHVALSEYSAAIQQYQRSIEIAREVKDRGSESDQLRGLAEILLFSGKADAALSTITAAIEIARDRRNVWLEARYLSTKASAQRSLGQFRQALNTCREARRLARGDIFAEANATLQAGEMQLLLRQRAGALRDLLRVLDLAREGQSRVVEAQSRNLLGQLQTGHRDPEAIKHFMAALSIGNEIRSPSILSDAHSGLATLYHRNGRWQEAREHYRDAIEAIETMRAGLPGAEDRAGFLTGRLDVYRGVVSLLSALHRKYPSRGYDAEAFHYVERGRARSYVEMIAAARGGRAVQSNAEAGDRERELRGRIADVQTRLVGAYSASVQRRDAVPVLQRELAKADEAYNAFLWEQRSRAPVDVRHPEPLRAAEVQRRLGDGRVLLEYSLGKTGSFLFALTADRLRVYRLPIESMLERDVADLRGAIGEAPSAIGLSNFVTSARKLYRNLVEPASALLRGAKEIVIAPDGILHYLPFEALLSEMPPAGAGLDVARLAYLIRNRSVSYTPSFGVLAALDDAAKPASLPDATLLAYADPSYGRESDRTASLRTLFDGPRWGLGRLRYSRQEVESIAKLFPTSQVKLRTGVQATERSLKDDADLSSYGVLHFAVHGVLHKTRPQLSGLALSLPDHPTDATAEDGLLQVYEIVKLKLNAGLVVLSACQTGLGKEVPGEGLVGLTQAFLYAGAASIAVSLWKVEDSSTAALMYHFHRRLRSSSNPASALREAKLEQIKGRAYAHPYYWAGFVLVGKSSPFGSAR